MPSKEKKRRMLASRESRAKRTGGAVSTLPPMRHAVARTPATSWPVVEVWVSTGWHLPGALPQIVVVRQDAGSEAIVAATFLVDLGCLGVKNADVKRYTSLEVFRVTMFAMFDDLQPMEPIDLDSAAKIIREGLRYAESLGFVPHRDYAAAARYLEGADPDASALDVPLGENGKPYFMNGPYDDVPAILAQLDKAVGRGNYTATLFAGPPDVDW
ncbi:MAG: hypothetical protein DCC58_14950 [Chloroflexi bacterium]|nr:MAG: hypothetical protein DCC58_14950 [Chloroflexota bacterium]